MRVSMTVNESTREHDVEPRLLLVQYLRDVCGLTGTEGRAATRRRAVRAPSSSTASR